MSVCFVKRLNVQSEHILCDAAFALFWKQLIARRIFSARKDRIASLFYESYCRSYIDYVFYPSPEIIIF